MKRMISVVLAALLCFGLAGCSRDNHPQKAGVTFRLENKSGQNIYDAAVSYGTEDTVFVSMSVQEKTGTEAELSISIPEADMQAAKPEDMVFEFFLCTQKDSDYLYAGRASVAAFKEYTITVSEESGKLTLNSNDPDLNILPNDPMNENNS